MSNYLINNLMVKLHPDKIYIQHYRKGLKFTGSVVKGKRLYTSNTTVSNTYMSIHKFNGEISAENVEHFVQSLNSYWGFMRHYSSYNVKMKIFELIDYRWFRYLSYNAPKKKFEIINKYKENIIVKRDLKNRNKFCKKYYEIPS